MERNKREREREKRDSNKDKNVGICTTCKARTDSV